MIYFIAALIIIAIVFAIVLIVDKIDEYRAVKAVNAAPAYRITRIRGGKVMLIDPIEKHSAVNGDGAWRNTRAQYPKRSTLTRDMEEPRGA